MKKQKSNKKLALVIGAALSFGMAFGTMPYDAAEAANYNLTQDTQGKYHFSKDNKETATMNWGELLSKDSAFVKALAEDNAVITIADAKTASSLSGTDLKMGKNSVLTVNGASSNATVKSGDTPSTVSVQGTTVTGDNVNLEEVVVNSKSGNPVGINVSGKIDSVKVAADDKQSANVAFGGNVEIGSLSVAEGVNLSVAEGKSLKTDSLTLAKGANLESSKGAVQAGTLTISEGATIESGATVAVKEIVVDASSADAATKLAETIKTMKISGVDGSKEVKVTVDTSKLSGSDKAKVDAAVKKVTDAVTDAGKNAGITVKKNQAISVSQGTDGQFTVNGNKVAGKELADAVSKAFEGETTQVTLDKSAAQAISNSGNSVTVPADKTLVVTDTNGATVSATPAEKSAALTITGNQISAPAGTHFKDVTVDAKGAKVDNTIKDAVIDNVTVKSGVLSTEKATVTNLTVDGGSVKAPELNAANATFNGGEIYADVKADNVTLGKGATIGAGQTISAKELVVEDVKSLTGLTVQGKDGATLKITKADGTKFTDDELKAIASVVPAGTTVNAGGETVKGEQGSTPSKPGDTTASEAEKAKTEAETARSEALKKIGGEYAAMSDDAIIMMAAANPFSTDSLRTPSASEISAMSNASDDTVKALSEAKDKLMAASASYSALAAKETDKTKQAEYTKLANELKAQAASLPTTASALKEQAAKLTAASQFVGKTAAAPGATSGRTASVITSVMTNNVTARTNDLRGMAAAIDDGREESENVWVQFKHTDMDVDNGGTYSKSKVNTNNIQLGYDTKLGANDYLGAYVGTTTGSADFSGPAASGSMDIDNAYDLGLYGTHMLPAGQYIDYMLHTGSFDSKYNGQKWGTTDTGAMVGYGAKIEQNTRLTLNPYVQLAYDHVDVGSYKAGNNQIASDASDNWTAKLGVNLLDVSGFYGGLAYSRGLSGSYNAYINGVPMPSNDNNANVVYLNLGYRANVARNTLLDLSMEKTFVDYDGWTAAGKVNFFF